MRLFDFLKPRSSVNVPQPAGLMPTAQIDFSKRYDIYMMASNEERVYENIRFLGIRKFGVHSADSLDLIGMPGSYLEVEASDGAVLMLASYSIQMICEHGTKPAFRVLRRWPDPWEG